MKYEEMQDRVSKDVSEALQAIKLAAIADGDIRPYAFCGGAAKAVLWQACLLSAAAGIRKSLFVQLADELYAEAQANFQKAEVK